MEIRSFSQLEKALKLKIQQAMENEVALTTKKTIQNQVAWTVYDAGNPASYDRRMLSNGSLGDIEEMPHDYDSKTGTLEVSNEADFNHSFASQNGYGGIDIDESLAYNIEYGYGSKDEWYNKPRSFMENAREDLRDGEFRKSLKEGLLNRGLKVE